MTELRLGDSARIGPFYAVLTDGRVLDLVGASIECGVGVERDKGIVIHRQNETAGGQPGEITVTDYVTGEFYVVLSSANTAGLLANTIYTFDARVKEASSGEVYTVGEGKFKTVRPFTPIPTP